MGPVILIAAIVAAIAASGGGDKRPTPKLPPAPEPEPEPLPPALAHYPVMTNDCSGWVIAPHPSQIDYAAYDNAITRRFREMRMDGETDLRKIAAAICREHNPQCQWPPGPSAPSEQKAFFNELLAGIEWYNFNCWMADPPHEDCTWGNGGEG